MRPHRIGITGDELPAIHYLYPLDATNAEVSRQIARRHPPIRSLDTLPWAGASIRLSPTLRCSSRWNPLRLSARDGSPLRAAADDFVFIATVRFDALTNRHNQFLESTRSMAIGLPFLRQSPRPTSFLIAAMTTRVPRPYAVFKLLDANEDAYRCPHAKLIHIAGMVRHVAIERMKVDAPGWIKDPADWVNRYVVGHRDDESTARATSRAALLCPASLHWACPCRRSDPQRHDRRAAGHGS